MILLARAFRTGLGPASATALIALTAVCFGLVPLFARELQALGLASPAIAFYRYAFSALVVLPFLLLSREKRGQALALGGAGLLVGVGWIGYLEAVKVTPVAAAGVVYMSYPLFAVLFAWAIAGLRPSPGALAAGIMVLAAAALLLDPHTLSAEAIVALVWSLPAPISFGLMIAVLSTMASGLAPLERMACAITGATLGLAPLLLSMPADAVLPSGPEGWLLVVGLGVVTALLPQLLYTLACPRVGPARSAAAGSFELPTMFAVGWFAFGETIGLREVIAAALVIGAIALSPTVPPARGNEPGHSGTPMKRRK